MGPARTSARVLSGGVPRAQRGGTPAAGGGGGAVRESPRGEDGPEAAGSRSRCPEGGAWQNLTQIFHLSYDFPPACLAYSSRRVAGSPPIATREGVHMIRPLEPASPLSPQRAFVVQFRAETDVAAGRL